MTFRSSSSALGRAGSAAFDAREAVREVHAAIEATDPALVVLYCSPHFDRVELADEIRACFGDLPVIGCTTVGHDYLAAPFEAHNVVGFATYGEQFHGMHVNQTFTGVALGREMLG